MRLGKKKDNKKIEQKLESASVALQFANKYQIWFLLIVAFVIIGAGYFLYLGPKFNELKEKSDNFLPNKEKILADLTKIENKLIRLDQKFQQVQRLKELELEQISAFLPEKPDYPQLFVQAESIASSNNIDLQAIDVTRTTDRPVSQRQTSGVDANPEVEQTIESLPSNVRSVGINIKLGGGTYEDFKNYLDDLEKNLRLYDVQTLAFDSIDAETGDVGGFSLTLKSYYQIPINE